MAETQRTKPTFEVLHEGVVPVRINGKVYNARVVGPGTWHSLRSAYYGKEFGQGTFGENLDLTHSAYLNQKAQEAQDIVGAVQRLLVTGNTAVLYTPQAIYVQDAPQVSEKRISMNAEELESKLGSREFKGVVFSNNGTIRRISYSFAREWQSIDEMKNNPFLIALTGDENSPEKLAEIMKVIRKKGYVWVLPEGTNNEIRVPGLNEGSGGLFLDGDDWGQFDDDGCSFGVRY